MTKIVPSRTPEERAKAAASAAEMLRNGNIVALPTETVYGLAGDALRSEAVAKIFDAGADRRHATEDLMWALVNTPEFVFKN